jgi:hypothetical protein
MLVPAAPSEVYDFKSGAPTANQVAVLLSRVRLGPPCRCEGRFEVTQASDDPGNPRGQGSESPNTDGSQSAGGGVTRRGLITGGSSGVGALVVGGAIGYAARGGSSTKTVTEPAQPATSSPASSTGLSSAPTILPLRLGLRQRLRRRRLGPFPRMAARTQPARWARWRIVSPTESSTSTGRIQALSCDRHGDPLPLGTSREGNSQQRWQRRLAPARRLRREGRRSTGGSMFPPSRQ